MANFTIKSGHSVMKSFELLHLKVLGFHAVMLESDSDYTNWAIHLLEQGFDSPKTRILAAMSSDQDGHFALIQQVKWVINELRFPMLVGSDAAESFLSGLLLEATIDRDNWYSLLLKASEVDSTFNLNVGSGFLIKLDISLRWWDDPCMNVLSISSYDEGHMRFDQFCIDYVHSTQFRALLQRLGLSSPKFESE